MRNRCSPVPPPPPRIVTIVARPAVFDLSLQIVTPEEQDALDAGATPPSYRFGGRAYELEWGAERIVGTTSREAVVEKRGLDGAIDAGTLRIGEVGGAGFSAAFAMPIRQVRPAEHGAERLLREVAMRLVNLGFLDRIDAPIESVREAVASWIHRSSPPSLRVANAAGGADEWPSLSLFEPWPDGERTLEAALARLRRASGEVLSEPSQAGMVPR